jgi:hypothetical protein
LLERFIKYNQAGIGYRTLSNIYANIGREQEARSMLDKATEGWLPTMKNVRFMMTMYPLKDLQVMERFAESFIKAGLPGEPSGFYKISEENRLAGEEIRDLFFGQKVTGFNMVSEKPWWIERSQDLCDQWDNLYENLKDCWVVYRNPEVTPDKNDEYLGVPGYGIYPFSLVE